MISPVNPAKAPARPSLDPWRLRVLMGAGLAGGLLAALTGLALRDGCANPGFAQYGGLTDCHSNTR